MMRVRENSSEHSPNQLHHKDYSKTIEKILGPEKDTLCGIGQCHGRFGQFLATPLTYLILSSVIALIQGLFITYSNATLSTVEKRYGLPSKLSGFTTTGNDLTQLLLSIPFAYYAGKGHRPRWLAFGMFLAAAGCFIAASPHYLLNNGYIEINSPTYTIDHLCGTNSTSEKECQDNEVQFSHSHYIVVIIFLVAQMLSGIASLLYYTVGYSYLDECVSKTKSPLFLSISGGFRLLGPVSGYALASWSLRKWVNPWLISSVNIETSHPGWIGAWWLGYLVIGCALLSISWLLILLPKTMPGTRQRRFKQLLDASEGGAKNFNDYVCSLREDKKVTWNAFVSSVKRLGRNTVFKLIVLNQTLFWFAFFGYITFKSKYLEHQFRLSAADANKYIAGVSLIAAVIGYLGTGAILSYFKPKPKTVITYMAILSFISMLCYVVQGSVYCEHEHLDNLSNFLMKNSANESISSCSEDCNCYLSFSPICDTVISKTYLNPCLAGCTSIIKSARNNEYHNCTCADSKILIPGYCSQECKAFKMYLVFSVIAKLSEAASRVPLNMLLFRSVEERDKDLGLGIFNAVLALGASVPAPILFGWLIDSTCTLWDTNCSGNTHCWMNNVTQFRSYIHVVPAVVLGFCFLTDLWLLKHHKYLKLYSEEIAVEK